MLRCFLLCGIALFVLGAEICPSCFAGDLKNTSEQSTEVKNGYIDIHVHASAFSDSDFNFEKLSEWMETNGVEKCVVLQFRPTLPSNDQERQKLVDNFRKYKGKIYRFCVIFAQDVTTKEEAVKILTKMKQEGAIGFGEHYGEGINVDDPKNMILYEACAEVGLPVLFHMDGRNNIDQVGLPRLEKVLKTHPDCVFIGHGPGWWANINSKVQPQQGSLTDSEVDQPCTLDRLLAKYPNIYGDLSAGSGARAIGRDKEFGRAFIIRNADKLMFGTDSGSWSYQKPPASQFKLLESFDLPDNVKAKIYRENAIRLLGLADPAASMSTGESENK